MASIGYTARPQAATAVPQKTEAPVAVVQQKLPEERVQLSATSLPVVAQVPQEVRAEPVAPAQETYTAPSTLVMEQPELIASSEVESGSPLATMSQALSAKGSSDAHWSAGLEAFTALPEDDKAAAGKRAFYTQAASLPQFAETLAGLPDDQKHMLPVMLMGAKESGAIDGNELNSMVSEWSANNPEEAYMAQMTGFADFAGEQLVAEAVKQNVGSLGEMKIGPREEALSKLSVHGNSYVEERADYLSGAHQLVTSGHVELAQQLLDA